MNKDGMPPLTIRDMKMPWYIDWIAEWLCLIQCLTMIATFCKINPQLEWGFIKWWTDHNVKKMKLRMEKFK